MAGNYGAGKYERAITSSLTPDMHIPHGRNARTLARNTERIARTARGARNGPIKAHNGWYERGNANVLFQRRPLSRSANDGQVKEVANVGWFRRLM